MPNQIAYLFPAFVLKYTGKELDILNKYNYNFTEKVSQTAQLLSLNIDSFDLSENNYLDDEFKNQICSYIFSCCYSDIIKKQLPEPTYISGFSMGLYAALYYAEAISFETGLQLIEQVFYTIKKILKDKAYNMASVIGFEAADLLKYLSPFKSIEIVIENGTYSHVIAGEKEEIKILLNTLQQEGAIHLSIFNVAFPYHSKRLKDHEPIFNKLVKNYLLNAPQIPLVSMINQQILTTSEQIDKEVANNIINPLNFYKTIQYLNQHNINSFIEVGADTSLLKSSKFIKGNFSFKAIAKGKVI